MGFYLRKRSSQTGLAPGTIVYGGVPRTEAPTLQLITYDLENLEERRIEDLDDIHHTPGKVMWLNVNGVHDEALLTRIGQRFGLHALGLEDIASTLQRAKVDEYTDHLFITLRMLGDGESRVAFSEQVTLAVGSNFVVSFQEMEGDVFEAVRRRLRESIGRIRGAGPDYLAYALMDVIVDDYFRALEGISDDLEALEDSVQERPPEDTLPRLRRLRSKLIMMRRVAWPLREAASRMLSGDLALMQRETQPYIRDLYDHIVQIIDVIESLREVGGSIHDLYMAAISNKMNEIMKVLTIIGTIFIPLTFIAGIYGMNFVNMPELQWPYGYPVAMGVMAAMAVLLVLFFRRKGWL
ncbi:MAG: magnesium/cobalt transporter CorA [Rhodothermales bacterium]|nr:magnesium/cobalt transporter CorA [Rhodothermales bacterium]MBO6778171.1 magnesium/cobalt transporter CorA [Rhodothermales bacterium]